jgi:LCP family protein required for cell wall assembly
VSDWSGKWFRDPKPQPPGDGPPGIGGEPTVSLPARGAGAAAPGMSGAPTSNWPAQPPPGGAATWSRRAQGPVSGYGGGRRRRLRPRRIVAIVALVIVVLLVVSIGLYFYLDSKLTRANVLVDYAGRPVAAGGQNWLITGSDSRQGLTRAQEAQLATGHDVTGQRTDTMMLLHIPSGGGPSVLLSLPRDSFLPIPGNGSNKLNAAFAFGGGKLLAETVQNASGLHIDHYMSIGFGGLVNVVNAVGGVRMCLPSAMNDPAAGLHLNAGCQTLNGAQALGFVRSRHLFANQDLQRVQDQRLFLRALLSKMTSPGTLVNPFATVPAAFGAAGALTVDQGTHLYQLMQVAFALRNPETGTVPIGSSGFEPNAGSVLYWNHAAALQLFNDMKSGQPVPKSLLTGSKAAPTG